MEYTEEEKKAIEKLSEEIKGAEYEGNGEASTVLNVKVVLNLIEKQKREIEKKEQRLIITMKTYEIVLLEYAKLEEKLEDGIPKEAIRKKIDSYTRAIADSNDGNLKHDLRAKIKELKELLGE